MTISTRDQLIDAMGNNASRQVIDKASLANAVAGQFFSLWTATGIPGAGSAPGAAANPTSATTGAFSFANQTAPATSYPVSYTHLRAHEPPEHLVCRLMREKKK